MCKAVRFSSTESNTIIFLKSSFKFSQSERSSIWYQRSELESFRTNAKVICRSTIRKRKLSSISSNNNEDTIKNYMDQDNTDICTRGLELATDAERKKRKHLANKIIVAAQKSMKASELATLCSNLSTSAIENAIKDARFDFLAAYHVRPSL